MFPLLTIGRLLPSRTPRSKLNGVKLSSIGDQSFPKCTKYVAAINTDMGEERFAPLISHGSKNASQTHFYLFQSRLLRDFKQWARRFKEKSFFCYYTKGRPNLLHAHFHGCFGVDATVNRLISTGKSLKKSDDRLVDEANESDEKLNGKPKKSNIHVKGVSNHWNQMFEALIQYKSEHGDTLVPADYPHNPQLGNWVDNQRQLFRMRVQVDENERSNVKRRQSPQGKDTNAGKAKAGQDRPQLVTEILNNESETRNDSPKLRPEISPPPASLDSRHIMTDEKIEALNSIDFVWNIHDHLWNIRYEELKKYVSEHGHSFVPVNYSKNEPLGAWAAKQRRKYRLRVKQRHETQVLLDEFDVSDNESDESALSDERIQKLNDLGFVWEVREAQWLERLEELRQYIANNGDSLVPKYYPTFPYLGRWVDKQRMDYKRYMNEKELKAREQRDGTDEDTLRQRSKKKVRKKPSCLQTGMTEERMRLLDAEHFIWDPHNHAWEVKYEELCNFVALNGHALVPHRNGSPLGRWVQYQRQQYKKYLNSEKTTMTEERIKRLETIGFAWNREMMKIKSNELKSIGVGANGTASGRRRI